MATSLADDLLSIGEVSERTGVTVSALRFYETQGLIWSTRSAGGQRRFPREVLRRIAFIRVAQQIGLSLARAGARRTDLLHRLRLSVAAHVPLVQPRRSRQGLGARAPLS